MSRAHLHRVLYIEDDPHIRQLVELTLEENGNLQVTGCADWRAAMEAARSNTPDLLLLDVILPEKDGVATLLELRQLPGIEQTPAIFLTVDVDLATTEKTRANLEPYSVIAKPFQVDKLYDLLMEEWEKLVVSN